MDFKCYGLTKKNSPSGGEGGGYSGKYGCPSYIFNENILKKFHHLNFLFNLIMSI